MNEKILKEKTKRVLNECQKHIVRINEANEDLKEFMPIDKECYRRLTKDEVQAMDQFLFRFSKLQDVMGRKLFRLAHNYDDKDAETAEILNKIYSYRDILIQEFHNAERYLESR